MDLHNTFLNEELIDNIFLKLKDREQVLFSHINTYTYNRYVGDLKYRVYKYVNSDYRRYYYYINIYKYNFTINELDKICDMCIRGIGKIFIINNYYYDLRYIFEIININKNIFNDYKFTNEIMDLRIIINNIRQCISFNRYETINNINNQTILIPLRNLNNSNRTSLIY